MAWLSRYVGTAELSAPYLIPCSQLYHIPVQTSDFLAGMGLGAIGDQLKDLRLSELLDTLPPGVDEAVAISKVRVSHVENIQQRASHATQMPCMQPMGNLIRLPLAS